MKKVNYDQNELFLKELKHLLKKHNIRFLGHFSERPFVTFKDRTQYYILYDEDNGLITIYPLPTLKNGGSIGWLPMTESSQFPIV